MGCPLKTAKALILAAAAVLLFSALSAFASGTETGRNPQKISSEVRESPGSLSWSPDGKKLAFIGKSLYIWDLEKRRAERVALKDPFYVCFLSAEEFLALHREGGANVLVRVDASSLKLERIAAGMEPDAVFPIDGNNILMLSVRAKPLKIGTDVYYGLFKYALKKKELIKLHASNRILPFRAGEGFLKNSNRAAINPSDTSISFFEYVRPPALAPYLKLVSVDYITGAVKEKARVDDGRFTVSGSWSPDGLRLALPGPDGRLRVLSDDGAPSPTYGDIRGSHPSWNPSGSQIFFGGYVVSSDGKVVEGLGAYPESVGAWSPDGTMLAYSQGGKLWLMGGFSPRFVPPDGPKNSELIEKAITLKELLMDGLLSGGEYQERLDRLQKKTIPQEGGGK